MLDRRITKGACELLVIIRRSGKSIPDWCEEHRIHRLKVEPLFNGRRWRRISVDLGKALARATKGRVRCEDFASDTAVKLDAPTKRRAA